jgi:PAS domain S-box-containing protein
LVRNMIEDHKTTHPIKKIPIKSTKPASNPIGDGLLDTLHAVEKAKREWEQTMDCIEDIIMVVDEKGIILRTNRALIVLTGTDFTRLLGQQWTEILETYGFDRQTGDGLQAEYLHTSGKWFSRSKYPIEKHVKTNQPGAVVMLKDITERKKAEERIAWLASFPQMSPYTIIELDSAGKVSYINSSGVEALPDLASEGLDHPFLAGLEPIFGELMAGSRIASTREVKVDTVWYLQTINYINTTGLFRIYANNITKRKLAEIYLSKEMVFNKSLIQTSPAFMTAISLNGKTLLMNKSMLEALGYTLEEVIDKDYITNFIPETDRITVLKAIKKRVGQQEAFATKSHLLRKDGSQVLVEWRGTPVMNAFGEHEFTFGVGIDITEREHAEQALQESEAKYRSIFENAIVGIYQTTARGRLLSLNHTMAQMHGFSSPEEMVEAWEKAEKPSFVREEDGRRIDELIRQQGCVQLFEMEVYKKDKSTMWVSVNAHAVRDKDGNTLYLEGTVVDITQRKRIEKVAQHNHSILDQKNKELEKAYNQLKTAQLQILQQEKMASIGQLAAGVAHEINNPIGFINGNLNSLGRYLRRLASFMSLESEAWTRVREYNEELGAIAATISEQKKTLKIDWIVNDLTNLIEESLEGTERVTRIVQDLKTFSRVDEAELKEADINQGLESTINIVWNELKYKATVKKEYGEIPRTKCNLGQLNQVFMNILVNAAHAIEKQGEIRVKTWHDNGHIAVSIADTGCGIPKEKLGRIFEPFFTTKEVGKGTGLGLSIAYDIVKKHGGDIGVESEVGNGTEFTIKIPIMEG